MKSEIAARSAALCSLILGLLAGCGSTQSPTSEGGALWALEGKVRLKEGAPSDGMRAALVWSDQTAEGSAGLPPYITSNWFLVQDLPIAAAFPASFSIGIEQLPPDEALGDGKDADGEKSGRIAVGHLVMYQDLDGSEELTRAKDRCATYFRDAVLKQQDTYVVVYYEPANLPEEQDESKAPRWNCAELQPGLNVFKESVTPPAEGGCNLERVEDKEGNFPIDVTIVGKSNEGAPLMCSEYGEEDPELLKECDAETGTLVCFPPVVNEPG